MKQYEQGMPITSVLEAQGRILVSGGGGNKIFGFANQVFLLDQHMNVLDVKEVDGVVFSSRAYENFVVIEQNNTFQLFEIIESKLAGPYYFKRGTFSPIIIKGNILFIRNNKICTITTREFLGDKKYKEKNTMCTEEDESSEEDRTYVDEKGEAVKTESGEFFVSLIKKEEAFLYSTRKEEDYFLIDQNKKHVMDNPISDYTNKKNLGYLVQIGNENTLVCMGDKKIIESKCTTIHTLGEEEYIVGNGDGCIIKYKKGREIWRRKIFKNSPVSSITNLGNTLYCSSIKGRIITLQNKTSSSFFRILTLGIAIAAGAACAKYVAKETVQKASHRMYQAIMNAVSVKVE